MENVLLILAGVILGAIGTFFLFPRLKKEKALKLVVERLKLVVARDKGNDDDIDKYEKFLSDNDTQLEVIEFRRGMCRCPEPNGDPCRCREHMVIMNLDHSDSLGVDTTNLTLKRVGNSAFIYSNTNSNKDVKSYITLNGDRIDVYVNKKKVKIKLD